MSHTTAGMFVLEVSSHDGGLLCVDPTELSPIQSLFRFVQEHLNLSYAVRNRPFFHLEMCAKLISLLCLAHVRHDNKNKVVIVLLQYIWHILLRKQHLNRKIKTLTKTMKRQSSATSKGIMTVHK